MLETTSEKVSIMHSFIIYLIIMTSCLIQLISKKIMINVTNLLNK